MLYLYNKFCVSVVAAMLLSLYSSNASAITRYVAEGGSNSGNDCAVVGTPCATLQHAIDQTSEGDEVWVAAGTYTDMSTIAIPTGYNSAAGVQISQIA